MVYPSISQYIESIKDAEDNFATLTNLRPVLGEDRNPVMTSGNFAVVFKMKDEEIGKFYAVKCFLKDQPNRAESYKLISDELEDVALTTTYLTKFRYLDKELFVDTNNSGEDEFPILLMDWVEGVTLDKYIQQHIDDQYALRMLAYRFSRLAMWLIPQPFAHGDIKPDNVMVQKDGTLTLIDYDGMYVPAMMGQDARENGSPNFRHPLRTTSDFNEHIDDFSLISILLSLCVISYEPRYWDLYGAFGRLLFTDKDYRNTSSSEILKEIRRCSDNNVKIVFIIFEKVLAWGKLQPLPSHLLELEKPKKPFILNTKTTKEDFANGWKDEYGAIYSFDRTRLLKVPSNNKISEYTIKEGTLVICNEAFHGCNRLHKINIPESVVYIGDYAFNNCTSLQQITIPRNVKSIGHCAFYCCKCELRSLSSFYRVKNNCLYNSNYTKLLLCCNHKNIITIPESVTSIEEGAFAGCENDLECLSSYFKIKDKILYNREETKLIKCWNKSKRIKIPNNVRYIGDHAFDKCYSLEQVIIPSSITYIGNGAFSWCTSLQHIAIPQSVKTIGKRTFSWCTCLKNITIPNGVTTIDDEAFANCESLYMISMPEELIKIGDFAFDFCESLSRVILSNNVETIGDRAFSMCTSLQDIKLPDTLQNIGDSAFSWCESLEQVIIPNGVNTICKQTFENCKSLKQVSIPNSVIIIGDKAFDSCVSLSHINIPDSVENIGNMAFYNCSSLQHVVMSANMISIGKEAFSRCESLEQLIIPEKVSKIGEKAFSTCSSLKLAKIPKSLTNIDEGVFSDCFSLVQISIPNSVESIGKESFKDCTSLKQISIPNSVTKIEDRSFSGCKSLEEITIPDKVVSIGSCAFSWCSSLRHVKISNSVANIGDSAFFSCYSLKEFLIQARITKIGEGAFSGCRCELKSLSPHFIVIDNILYNENCTKIISCCNKEKIIKIPDSVIKIGDYAFYNCSVLEQISLPEHLSSIGYEAFDGCKSLKLIYVSMFNYSKIRNMLPQGLHNKIKQNYI